MSTDHRDRPTPPPIPDDMPEDLPYGIDRELFLGIPGETPEERAARLAAARDVLDDLRRQGEHDEITAQDAGFAAQLTRAVPLRRRSTVRRHRRTHGGAGDAA